jgi:hypothetical protein
MPSAVQVIPTFIVYDYLIGDDGKPIVGAVVSLTLNYPQANFTNPIVGIEPTPVFSNPTDGNGYWQVSVPANVGNPPTITPLNSLFTVEVVGSARRYQVSVSNIGVPAVGWQSSAIVVGVPAVLQPAGQTVGPLTVTGPLGVTGAITFSALTQGQVPFPGPAGLLSGDAGLFWDNVNKRLGVGTNVPAAPFHNTGTSLFGETAFMRGVTSIWNDTGVLVFHGTPSITMLDATTLAALFTAQTGGVTKLGFAAHGDTNYISGDGSVGGQLQVYSQIVPVGNTDLAILGSSTTGDIHIGNLKGGTGVLFIDTDVKVATWVAVPARPHGMRILDTTNSVLMEFPTAIATGITVSASTKFLKSLVFSTQTPASVTPLVVDASVGDHVLNYVLTANQTIGAPTNGKAGEMLFFTFTQNGTGGWTVTWNAVFPRVTWSDAGNAANTRSSIAFVCLDGTNWLQVGAQRLWA